MMAALRDFRTLAGRLRGHSTPVGGGPAPAAWRRYGLRSLVGLVCALVVVQAYVVIDARPGDVLTGIGGIVDIVRRGVPPDPSVLGSAVYESLVTVDVAVIGTALAIAFSLLLAFWAAENVTPGGARYVVSRSIIAFFRAIPDIVWALLFVTAVGLGPFAATMGLAVHSIGVLGRLYAEAIEDVNMASINALVVTGASGVQVATHAVLPATMPTLIGLTLYRLDTNVRSSLVLGFVGGGGLGFAIENALNLFQYQKLVALLIVMALLIAGVEAIAVALRRTIH
jgi:phosphonate transport system permease protein